MSLSKSELYNIIQPVDSVMPSQGYDVEITYFQHQLDSLISIMPLELNPDFQRGYVWTEEQKINYLEALFQRKLSLQARIISFNRFGYDEDEDELNENNPIYKKFICIDGLQRLTAIQDFINCKFTIFGKNKLTLVDISHPLITNNAKSVLRFNFYNFENKKDLMNFYVHFNSGGTIHSKEEIDKVKQMILDIDN